MTASLTHNSPMMMPQKDGSLLSLLQKEYDGYIHAVKAKNVAHILSLLTSDFVWTLADGTTYDRQQTEEALHAMFQTMTFEQMSIAILGFTADGVEATTRLQENSSGLLKEAEASYFSTVETIDETWKQTDAGWKISAATVLQSQMFTRPL